MPRQGLRRLPAGERDRRLAEEVLYLHSLWRRGGPVPAPAPIKPRSDRRQERESEPVLAPLPPASSRETLAEAAGAPAPSTANPPGPLAQREGVPSWLEFSNRDFADYEDDGSDSERDKEEEGEAAMYFTGLFQRDVWLRCHYTGRWRKGRFQCMVCAAGASDKVGKAVRRFRGCLALVRHALDASRGRSLCGRNGRRGAHRALAAVVCRMLGWDIDKLALPRIVIDPRATAVVQHAKENDGAGENNGFSTDDDSYSIDEDEESDDEESVDEEEDIETGIPDPATDGDEEDSEIENDEQYAEKEDRENRMEDSSTDGDEDANELERSKGFSKGLFLEMDKDKVVAALDVVLAVTTKLVSEEKKRKHDEIEDRSTED